MLIQLLYFPGCPHVATARQALQRAVAKLDETPPISEIDVTDDRTPEPLRLWGSPTILVDGVDVGGGRPSGSSCRLYPDSDNLGAPSNAMIEAALRPHTQYAAASVPTIREVTPVFQVKSVEASVKFYGERLGFIARYREGDGFAIVQRDGVDMILTGATDERWRTRLNLAERPVASGAESFLAGTGSCRIRVEGVDQLHEAYQGQGVIHPNGPLRTQWWGVREFAVLDLDGNSLTFFETTAPTKPSP